MIRLITFDLDDTLWDNKPVIRRAVDESYNWLFERCPELAEVHTAESLSCMKLQLQQQVPELRHRVSQVRIVGMQQALEQVGYNPTEALNLARQAFEVFHHWRHQVDLFDHVEAVLAALAREYQLAAITNGNACVERLGLGDYFRFSISSEQTNRSKPDPEVFRIALSRAGLSAAEAIHIGDNMVSDVVGAADAGMNTIWFNLRQDIWNRPECQPDQTVTSLADIPTAVRAIVIKTGTSSPATK